MRVLDLFSGIGGFSLGLERAGMTTVAFCESNPARRRVLEKHWPEVPIYDDVRTMPALGGIDIICGGWPCQTFSTAARGRNRHPDLWPDMLRIIERERPTWVLAENVSAALRGFDRIADDLEALDYACAAVDMDTALPERQRARQRALVVAHANGKGEPWCGLYAPMACVSADAGRGRPSDSPFVGVDDGVSGRMDRLRGLGNAVVPQVIEAIGHAIAAVESRLEREGGK